MVTSPGSSKNCIFLPMTYPAKPSSGILHMLEIAIAGQTFDRLLDRLRSDFGQDDEMRLREVGPARIDAGFQLLFKPNRIYEKQPVARAVPFDFHIAQITPHGRFELALSIVVRRKYDCKGFFNNFHGFSYTRTRTMLFNASSYSSIVM